MNAPAAASVKALAELVPGEEADFEEGRSGIEQARDAFARDQLAARGMAGAGIQAAALFCGFGGGGDRLHRGLMLGDIRLEGGGGGKGVGGEFHVSGSVQC